MARSNREKARAKANRKQIRSNAKAAGKTVSRAQVQQKRQQQNTNRTARQEIRQTARDSGTSVNRAGVQQQRQDQKAAANQQRRQNFDRSQINQQVNKASDYRFDKFRKNSVNAAEIRNLHKQGHSAADIRNAALESGLRMGGAAERRLDRMDRRAEAKDRAEQHIENTTTAATTPTTPEPVGVRPVQPVSPPPPPPTTMEPPRIDPVTPPPSTVGPPPIAVTPPPGVSVNPVQDNDQTQQVQQDNDITTSISGNDNYVNNIQDNSIRQYGGDNRQFTYVSNGGNPATDDPTSMATMAGYYDVDDSPAKQAKFLDLHTTLNRDNQKKYLSTGHIAEGAVYRSRQRPVVDRGAIDARIHNREQYSRAKAEMMGMHLFGDMYGYTPPQYQLPTPEKPVEKPDFGEMYDDYTQF